MKGAYQNQRGIVELISSINIRAFSDHLLTDLQIASTTSFGKPTEALAEVERAILLQPAILDQLLLFVKTSFELVLSKDHVDRESKPRAGLQRGSQILVEFARTSTSVSAVVAENMTPFCLFIRSYLIAE